MSESAIVVCGLCQVEPEVVSDSNGDRLAVCPKCGQSDKADDAVTVAEEHAVDAIKRGFQSGLGDAVKNSKILKFSAERIPKRTFRWHLVANG